MIDSVIPLDTYILSKDHIPLLDIVPIKSSPNFPFEYDLTNYGSLDDGIFEPLDSTIELEIGYLEEIYYSNRFFVISPCSLTFFNLR